MTAAGWTQLAFVVALLAISTPLLGTYMAKVYGSKRAPGDRVFLPVERAIYRMCGVDPGSEQRWQTYALSLLAFSFASVVVLYAQIRLQEHLPQAQSLERVLLHDAHHRRWEIGTNIAQPARDVRRGTAHAGAARSGRRSGPAS